MATPSLHDTYRAELRAALNPAGGAIVGLAINALLLIGAWWILPERWTSGTLFKVHAGWAFPAVLASWMLADTFATNVFGGDAPRMRALLDDPAALRRTLLAKDLVLWTLVVPPCVLVTLIAGGFVDQDWRLAAGAVIITAMPFASLGFASMLGVVMPYHPIPLMERWRERRRLGLRNLRWGTLVVLPYVMIGPLTALGLAPTIALWLATTGNLAHVPPDWAELLGVILAAATAAAAWLGGNALTLRTAQRRKAKLQAYLADRARG